MGHFVLSISAVIFLLSIQRGQCAHIVGGKESVPHSRPYMAALSLGPTSFFCGGTLIHENWVLTAAHCMKWFRNNALNIVLGAHVQGNYIESGRQYIGIARYFLHPDYDYLTKEHDIMLLELQEKARIDEYVQPVQLPRTATDVLPGTRCVVIGWGQTFRERSSEILREVDVTVMDRNICNDAYHYAYPAVQDNMLCASDNTVIKGSCYGDSGGPLICNGEQKGIVSFGRRCGDPRNPGVYTRFTEEHLYWISNIINGQFLA